MKKLLFILPFLLFFISSVQAQSIFSCNSTGGGRGIFYTNESIFVTSSVNITPELQAVRVYIVTNNDSWTDGTTLNDVTGSYKTRSTNETGYLLVSNIWQSPAVGIYDIVADVDSSGTYNSTVDFVDHLTTTGFQVLLAPIPTLYVSKGPNSPADHSWDIEINGTDYNPMIQLNLTAGSSEGIRVNTVNLLGSGSGNDKTGVSLIRLILDENNNGVYDTGEALLAYNNYLRDDGLSILTITDGYTINANSSVHMLILYTMKDSVSAGETFSLQVISISAVGTTSGDAATVTGLSINSAVKTIAGAPPPTPGCSDYQNETSCLSATGCKWCDYEAVCKNETETCQQPPTCSGPISLSLQKGNETSTADITGLSNCDGKTAYLRQDSCNGSQIDSCSVSGEGCSITFSNPTEPGDYNYYACVDIDDDGVFEADEQALGILTIEQVQPEFQFPFEIIILIVVVIVIVVVILIFLKVRASRPKRYEQDPFEELKRRWGTQ